MDSQYPPDPDLPSKEPSTQTHAPHASKPPAGRIYEAHSPFSPPQQLDGDHVRDARSKHLGVGH